jgi:hypothetical protein
MAQARGDAGAGSGRRGAMARLKELPWAALVVLILMLIVLLAMWGKWPHADRRPPEAPTGSVIGLRSPPENSTITSSAARPADRGPTDKAYLFNRRSLQHSQDRKYQEPETHGL